MKPETIVIFFWATESNFVLTKLFLSGKKALSIFPDTSTVVVHYRDRFASGRSMQSWKTKMGSAKNVLDIVVTDKELWLKSMSLFMLFPLQKSTSPLLIFPLPKILIVTNALILILYAKY